MPNIKTLCESLPPTQALLIFLHGRYCLEPSGSVSYEASLFYYNEFPKAPMMDVFSVDANKSQVTSISTL